MRPIVTVDGIDGSGKSTFAQRLVAALADAGARPVLFRVDDFRQPVAWTTPDEEAARFYDGYYDLEACARGLTAFVDGAAVVRMPIYDIAAERTVGAREVDVAEATVAVVEGVFPLRMAPAAAGILIYLDASEQACRDRIVARDLGKGRTVEEIDRRIELRYFPSQRRYQRDHTPRERADIVIDNETPAAPRTVRRELSRVPEPLRRVFEGLVPPPAAG